MIDSWHKLKIFIQIYDFPVSRPNLTWNFRRRIFEQKRKSKKAARGNDRWNWVCFCIKWWLNFEHHWVQFRLNLWSKIEDCFIFRNKRNWLLTFDSSSTMQGVWIVQSRRKLLISEFTELLLLQESRGIIHQCFSLLM